MQEEIDRLQTSFTEDLATDAVDSDMADQLAMQSSLAVLAERMATIHMKASGKQQILEVFFLKIVKVQMLVVFLLLINQLLFLYCQLKKLE